jgi:hypothetical protein
MNAMMMPRTALMMMDNHKMSKNGHPASIETDVEQCRQKSNPYARIAGFWIACHSPSGPGEWRKL